MEQNLDKGKTNNTKLKKESLQTSSKKTEMPNSETNSSSLDDKNTGKESMTITCSTCNVELRNLDKYFEHKTGLYHKQTVDKQQFNYSMSRIVNYNPNELPPPLEACDVCEQKFFDHLTYKKHINSAVHKRKVKEIRMKEGSTNKGYYAKCEICYKIFNDRTPYERHLEGESHKKALRRIEMEKNIEGLYTKDETDKIYICIKCKHPFSDPISFKAHIDNNSHQKYNRQIVDFVKKNPDLVARPVSEFESESDFEKFEIEDTVLMCVPCHISFTSFEKAVLHICSKKHLKAKEALHL